MKRAGSILLLLATGCGDPAPTDHPADQPYAITLLDRARIGSDSSAPNFQRATATLAPLAAPAASVQLVVDLESTCFPFEGWATNPPPPGQNWPADCDAFDRNFEVLLAGDAPTAPRLELIRAITPFGGPLRLTADVTDLMSALAAARGFEIVIPTYADAAGQVTGSNGGWTVSARLDVQPGAPPHTLLAAIPLLDASADGSALTRTLPFSLPAGTTRARIEYRATGHGGGALDRACSGPADEFCLRRHTLSLDGALLQAIEPWRDDCNNLCTTAHYAGADAEFDYCAENPCANMASARAPRANWCPGSETPPFVWTPPSLTGGGAHELTYAIDTIGGSWRLTAAVYAYAD